MSYIGSAISLGSTLAGSTQESLMYINRSLQIASGYPNLIYDDGTGGYNLGFGVGPVDGVYSTSGVGTAAGLQGVLHVEDPGPLYGYWGTPGIYVQSRYRSPQIVLYSVKDFAPGAKGNKFTIGINDKDNDLQAGTKVDDVVLTSNLGSKYFRFGEFRTGLIGAYGPTVSIATGPQALASGGAVGIFQDNPIATLHAGCGSSIPITSPTPTIYASKYGDTSIVARDSTNAVELVMGTGSAQPFFGTATPHDLYLRLNNVDCGIFQKQGNFFLGTTSASSYNPEASVIGLTGYPSAALSIAGNRTSDGSIGQVAFYNDAPGIGVQAASVLVSRAGADNNAKMELRVLNAGVLQTAISIGSSTWVGVGTVTPQQALDVTGGVQFSGVLAPVGNAGLSGQYLQSNGPSSAPTWATSTVGTPGGPSNSIQFNASGTLFGSTNFVWNDSLTRLGVGTSTLTYVQNPESVATVVKGTTAEISLVGTTSSNNQTFGQVSFFNLNDSSNPAASIRSSRTASALATLEFWATDGFLSPVQALAIVPDNTVVTGNLLVGIRNGAPSSTLHVNGSIATAITSISSSMIATTNSSVLLADASAASFIVALPDAGAGRRYSVKKTDASANVVMVAPVSGLIDGVTQRSLTTQYQVVDIVTDGTDYYVM